jgi:F-type H+-transporting ATPase subunit b
MQQNTIMKRIYIFTLAIITAGIVFGIGLNYSSASTPTNLQPASGQSEFRAEDGVAEADKEAGLTSEDGEAKEAAAEDTGVVGMFGLDWKLFAAQLVNFGIILFVLWKWVFGPVTRGLSERTEKIENSLADAQKIAEDRQTFDSWKNGEMSQVRTEAVGIITEAKEAAEKLKQETLDQTKLDQSKLIANAQVKLEQEKQAMLESVKADLADLVVSATSAIIKQKLDPKKDSALIEQALKEASRGGNR